MARKIQSVRKRSMNESFEAPPGTEQQGCRSVCISISPLWQFVQLQRLFSEIAHPVLCSHAVQRIEWQAEQLLHTGANLPQRLREGRALLLVRANDRRR